MTTPAAATTAPPSSPSPPLTPSPPLPPSAAVVIVGSGIAASAAAAELCRARPDVRVTMVSREARVKVSEMERDGERMRGHPDPRAAAWPFCLIISSVTPLSQAAINVVRLSKYVESFDGERA